MRSVKRLLGAALVLASLVGCADLQGGASAAKSTNPAKSTEARDPEFGDFGYNDVYRYYGGPAAADQEFAIRHRQDPHVTPR